MAADEFEAWWERYKEAHSVAGYAKTVAREAWYAGKVKGMEAEAALDTSPWLDKTTFDHDGVDPFTEAALMSKGNARARLEAASEKLNRKGICDACSDTVPWDDLYIISTPQLSGVAMCMECRLISGPYCEVPPEGWWCSRMPKHDGPCAARPDDGLDCRTCGKKRCLCQLDLFPDGGHE